MGVAEGNDLLPNIVMRLTREFGSSSGETGRASTIPRRTGALASRGEKMSRSKAVDPSSGLEAGLWRLCEECDGRGSVRSCRQSRRVAGRGNVVCTGIAGWHWSSEVGMVGGVKKSSRSGESAESREESGDSGTGDRICRCPSGPSPNGVVVWVTGSAVSLPDIDPRRSAYRPSEPRLIFFRAFAKPDEPVLREERLPCAQA